MADSTPLVSVGVPVYNGEKYLAGALDSLCAQDYSELEIIISDNASTDETADICAEYAKRDGRIQYFRNVDNLGAVPNFNRLVGLARGDFFLWAAHDDRWLPGFISACVGRLLDKPDAVACYTRYQPIGSSGQKIGSAPEVIENLEQTVRARWQRMLSCWPLHAAIYGVLRTSAMRRTRLIQTSIGCDLVFMTELAVHGQVVQVPEVLAEKRVPETGTPYRTPAEMYAYLGGQKRGSFHFLRASILADCVEGALRAELSLGDRTALAFDTARLYGSEGLWLVDLKEAVLRAIRRAPRPTAGLVGSG
jgi:glycosyltransferase involved in cell wall biosynthesis